MFELYSATDRYLVYSKKTVVFTLILLTLLNIAHLNIYIFKTFSPSSALLILQVLSLLNLLIVIFFTFYMHRQMLLPISMNGNQFKYIFGFAWRSFALIVVMQIFFSIASAPLLLLISFVFTDLTDFLRNPNAKILVLVYSLILNSTIFALLGTILPAFIFSVFYQFDKPISKLKFSYHRGKKYFRWTFKMLFIGPIFLLFVALVFNSASELFLERLNSPNSILVFLIEQLNIFVMITLGILSIIMISWILCEAFKKDLSETYGIDLKELQEAQTS